MLALITSDCGQAGCPISTMTCIIDLEGCSLSQFDSKGRDHIKSFIEVMVMMNTQSMQQKQTVLQHDGPNHLALALALV